MQHKTIAPLKFAGLASATSIALSLLLLLGLNARKTDLLISFGTRLFKFFNTSLIILLIASIVTLIGVVALYISKQQQVTKEREIQAENAKDPLYDEPAVIEKLEKLRNKYDRASTTESVLYANALQVILQQLEDSKTLLDDFAEITENNQQPIIQNIASELVSIRIHILSDAKSIYRRAVVTEDYADIEAKLNHNRKLLNDADNLIVEAIRYIDIKSNATDVDLKNLTDSLKDLMKMI